MNNGSGLKRILPFYGVTIRILELGHAQSVNYIERVEQIEYNSGKLKAIIL
jgi:hypothetical protein